MALPDRFRISVPPAVTHAAWLREFRFARMQEGYEVRCRAFDRLPEHQYLPDLHGGYALASPWPREPFDEFAVFWPDWFPVWWFDGGVVLFDRTVRYLPEVMFSENPEHVGYLFRQTQVLEGDWRVEPLNPRRDVETVRDACLEDSYEEFSRKIREMQ